MAHNRTETGSIAFEENIKKSSSTPTSHSQLLTASLLNQHLIDDHYDGSSASQNQNPANTDYAQRPHGHVHLKHFDRMKILPKNSSHPMELWKMKNPVHDFSQSPHKIYYPEYYVKRAPDHLLHLKIEAAHAELRHLILPEYTPSETFIVYDEKGTYGLAVRKLDVFSPLSEMHWDRDVFKKDPELIFFLGAIFSFAYLAGEDDLNKEQFDIIHKKLLDPDMQAWPVTRHFKGDRFNERRNMQDAFEVNLNDFLNLPFYKKANPNYGPHHPCAAEIRNSASMIYDENWAKKQYSHRDQDLFKSVYQEPNFEYAKFKIFLRFMMLDTNTIQKIYEKHIDPQEKAILESQEKTVIKHFVDFYIQRITHVKQLILNNSHFLMCVNRNYSQLCQDFENYKTMTNTLSQIHFREYDNTEVSMHAPLIFLKKPDEKFKAFFAEKIKNHKKLLPLDHEIDFLLINDSRSEDSSPLKEDEPALDDSDEFEEVKGTNDTPTPNSPPNAETLVGQSSVSIPIQSKPSQQSNTSTSAYSPSPSPKSPSGLFNLFRWGSNPSSSHSASSQSTSSNTSVATSPGERTSPTKTSASHDATDTTSSHAQAISPSSEKRRGWFS